MLAHAQQDAPEPEKLYRIGDVSRLTDTKPFVLRFWETEFPMLQPVKAPKGHRLYRQEDIDLIRAIKRLLYEEGFTIPGARRHLSELIANGEGLASLLETDAAAIESLAPPLGRGGADAQARSRVADAKEVRQTLRTLSAELRAILTLLGTR
jgi:DNA-binding transcriptional MerR regulator